MSVPRGRRVSADDSQFARDTPRIACEILEHRLLLADFVVSTVADLGGGSLRQAILDANALAGADTIGFSSLFTSPRTIVLASPLPQIGQQLAIVGSGSSLLTVRLNAGFTPVSGVFSSTASDLTLSGMTITGANINGGGGGLQSTGPGGPNVTIDDCVFTGNTVTGLGGAIFLNNNTTLTIRNSTVSNNQAATGSGICFFDGGSLVMENCTLSHNIATASTSGGGAGLDFFGAALPAPPAQFTPSTLLIRGSTFSDNTSARAGGAILVDTFSGTLLVQNSTFSGNVAATGGGAIAATGGSGTVRAQNSTIASNTADGAAATGGGGGIYRASTVNNAIQLMNTIVSGNSTPSANSPEVRTDSFTTTTVNNSAIGSAAGFTLAAGSSNNLPLGANLMLGALANSGGPTKTRAVLAGSQLINAGSAALTPAALTTDQRPGHPRNVGGQVDIGAFERGIGPTVTARTFQFETAPQSIRFTFSGNVAASLSVADLQLENLSNSTILPSSTTTLTYNAATNAATFTVATPASGILPDALYRATLLASAVGDAGGFGLVASDVLDFHVLAGDANRDRKVNFDDLVILAQNYGLAGRTFSQGNFNYSTGGGVDFDDLVILAQQYNTSLITAAVFAPATPALHRRRSLDPLID